MRRALGWIGAALVLLMVGAGVVYLPPLRQAAAVGAGFVAKQMCSCVYVAGRSFESCRPEMMEEMAQVRSEALADGEETGVRAWVTLLAERRARFHEDFGCTLH